MSDHSELKKLAQAATPGRWTAYDTHGRRFIEAIGTEDHVVCATPKKQWLKDSEYIAAADPVTVLALIAEVEGLRAQHGRDSAELRSLCQARDDARKERDQLKVEVEALRKDAERYRWLRSGSDYSVAVHEGPELDKVIDRAMSEAAKQ